ncbi:leucine-rich repeat protein [Plasmodium berghei]|uniref:Leucine-rich repeat protein n=1 Tax=Plasmodium berghei TaxID=5821 RepID=A0A1C6Y7Q3_PLABE|nr:leucine-rich repeat protein [Plasmodium berghei]SCO58915.1 leucine-rich repeat protein [Plasmodium berghei]
MLLDLSRCKLKSLEDSDVILEKLIELNCDYTSITYLDVSYNNIKSIKGLRHFENLKILNISNNELTSLDGDYIPCSTEKIICDNNNLSDIYFKGITNEREESESESKYETDEETGSDDNRKNNCIDKIYSYKNDNNISSNYSNDLKSYNMHDKYNNSFFYDKIYYTNNNFPLSKLKYLDVSYNNIKRLATFEKYLHILNKRNKLNNSNETNISKNLKSESVESDVDDAQINNFISSKTEKDVMILFFNSLETLHLRGNKLTNLKGLSVLKNLKVLDLRSNLISHPVQLFYILDNKNWLKKYHDKKNKNKNKNKNTYYSYFSYILKKYKNINLQNISLLGNNKVFKPKRLLASVFNVLKNVNRKKELITDFSDRVSINESNDILEREFCDANGEEEDDSDASYDTDSDMGSEADVEVEENLVLNSVMENSNLIEINTYISKNKHDNFVKKSNEINIHNDIKKITSKPKDSIELNDPGFYDKNINKNENDCAENSQGEKNKNRDIPTSLSRKEIDVESSDTEEDTHGQVESVMDSHSESENEKEYSVSDIEHEFATEEEIEPSKVKYNEIDAGTITNQNDSESEEEEIIKTVVDAEPIHNQSDTENESEEEEITRSEIDAYSIKNQNDNESEEEEIIKTVVDAEPIHNQSDTENEEEINRSEIDADSIKNQNDSESEEEINRSEIDADSIKNQNDSESEEEINRSEIDADSIKNQNDSESEEEINRSGIDADSIKNQNDSENEEEEINRSGIDADSIKNQNDSENEEEEINRSGIDADSIKNQNDSESEEEEITRSEIDSDSIKSQNDSEHESEEEEITRSEIDSDSIKNQNDSENEEEEITRSDIYSIKSYGDDGEDTGSEEEEKEESESEDDVNVSLEMERNEGIKIIDVKEGEQMHKSQIELTNLKIEENISKEIDNIENNILAIKGKESEYINSHEIPKEAYVSSKESEMNSEIKVSNSNDEIQNKKEAELCSDKENEKKNDQNKTYRDFQNSLKIFDYDKHKYFPILNEKIEKLNNKIGEYSIKKQAKQKSKENEEEKFTGSIIPNLIQNTNKNVEKKSKNVIYFYNNLKKNMLKENYHNKKCEENESKKSNKQTVSLKNVIKKKNRLNGYNCSEVKIDNDEKEIYKKNDISLKRKKNIYSKNNYYWNSHKNDSIPIQINNDKYINIHSNNFNSNIDNIINNNIDDKDNKLYNKKNEKYINIEDHETSCSFSSIVINKKNNKIFKETETYDKHSDISNFVNYSFIGNDIINSEFEQISQNPTFEKNNSSTNYIPQFHQCKNIIISATKNEIIHESEKDGNDNVKTKIVEKADPDKHLDVIEGIINRKCLNHGYSKYFDLENGSINGNVDDDNNRAKQNLNFKFEKGNNNECLELLKKKNNNSRPDVLEKKESSIDAAHSMHNGSKKIVNKLESSNACKKGDKKSDNKLGKNKIEKNRVEKNRVEKNRVEKNRVENNRVEKNRVEKNRVEKNRVEKNRVENNRVEKNKIEKLCKIKSLQTYNLPHSKLPNGVCLSKPKPSSGLFEISKTNKTCLKLIKINKHDEINYTNKNNTSYETCDNSNEIKQLENKINKDSVHDNTKMVMCNDKINVYNSKISENSNNHKLSKNLILYIKETCLKLRKEKQYNNMLFKENKKLENKVRLLNQSKKIYKKKIKNLEKYCDEKNKITKKFENIMKNLNLLQNSKMEIPMNDVKMQNTYIDNTINQLYNTFLDTLGENHIITKIIENLASVHAKKEKKIALQLNEQVKNLNLLKSHEELTQTKNEYFKELQKKEKVIINLNENLEEIMKNTNDMKQMLAENDDKLKNFKMELSQKNTIIKELEEKNNKLIENEKAMQIEKENLLELLYGKDEKLTNAKEYKDEIKELQQKIKNYLHKNAHKVQDKIYEQILDKLYDEQIKIQSFLVEKDQTIIQKNTKIEHLQAQLHSWAKEASKWVLIADKHTKLITNHNNLKKNYEELKKLALYNIGSETFEMNRNVTIFKNIILIASYRIVNNCK